MSSKERTALLLLLGIGLGGHALRLVALGPEAAPGGIRFAGVVPVGNLALHRARSVRLGRPLGSAERVDLNTAPIEELARLPRVGVPLARAILRTRARLSGFITIAELDSVPGIGPGLIAALSEHLTVSDTGRVRDRRQAGRGRAVAAEPAPPPPVTVLTGRPRSAGKAGSTLGSNASPRPPISLNSATESELVTLPGIGPTRAKAIVAYRQSNGPFASVRDLEKVPGIPRRLVDQLAAQVVIR